MGRYTTLFESIALLEANHRTPDMQDKEAFEFPFPQMYTGQKEILMKVKPDESFSLTSHTGFGKSPVFLSLIRNKSALVIEPRKFLQSQVSETYYKDYVLYGRSGYPCTYAETAAIAPCLLKEDCSDTNYHETCISATKTCLVKPHQIFRTDTTFQIYPCKDCEYIAAQQEAVRVLKKNGVVICNFGNFWNLLKQADVVVVDEADLFFREISAPIRLKYSNPQKNSGDSVKVLMELEVKGLQNAAKDKDPSFRYKAQNALYNAQFLKEHADLCFKYQRKDRIYVEVDPRNVNILSKKIFKDKRLIIVSATPGQFELPSYSASIHQRCRIYFAPVGNLTSRSLKMNPHLMSQAARAIVEISTHMDCVYDADRVIVHCGNIGTHATSLYKILGEQDCTLHEGGKLAETIDKYLASGKKYLLVAAAEYGMDASWSKLQFILKFPYPNLDERMRTLEKNMGPEFSSFYEGEARTRVIQMAGRNVRGFDDFGITVCLDSKCMDDYRNNTGMYPGWFCDRVDGRCY